MKAWNYTTESGPDVSLAQILPFPAFFQDWSGVGIVVKSPAGIVVRSAVDQHMRHFDLLATQLESTTRVFCFFWFFLSRQPSIVVCLAVCEAYRADGADDVFGVAVETIVDVVVSLAGVEGIPFSDGEFCTEPVGVAVRAVAVVMRCAMLKGVVCRPLSFRTARECTHEETSVAIFACLALADEVV